MRNNKILSILILLFVFAGQSTLAQQDKPTYAKASEDKPKLRWEYKYQEGECLKYWMEGRNWLKGGPGVGKGYDREVEAVLGINVYGEIEKWKRKIITWTKVKKEGEEDMQWHSSNKFGEGVTGGLEFTIDGNAKGLVYTDIFFLGQPRFVESGLDLWSKDIYVNEALGQTAGSHMTFTAHYRKLGDETVDGENCVVIETEIGKVPSGTKEERGTIYSIAGNDIRMELYAKSWFSQEKGRVIKMDSELIIYQDGKESLGDKFHFKLLSKEDIKKLDGIEDNWELVLPDTNNFQLLPDGRIIFVKEEIVKENVVDSTSMEGFKGKDVKKSFIWMCDGDGSNQKRLMEGTNLVVSPDGKIIALKKETELWVIDVDGKNLRKLADGFCQKYGKQIQWSPDSKGLGFVTCEGNLGIVYIEDKNEKKTVKVGDIELNNISWSSQSDRIFFFIEDHYSINGILNKGGFYKYDVKNDRLEEENSLKKFNYFAKGGWSSNELIYAAAGGSLSLLYYSETGEVIKKEDIADINKENPVIGFYWSSDGKFLIYNTYEYYNLGKKEESALKRGYFIYSLKEHKIIWESKEDWGNFSFGKEWNYFSKRGELTQSLNVYKAKRPKELIEVINKAW